MCVSIFCIQCHAVCIQGIKFGNTAENMRNSTNSRRKIAKTHPGTASEMGNIEAYYGPAGMNGSTAQ